MQLTVASSHSERASFRLILFIVARRNRDSEKHEKVKQYIVYITVGVVVDTLRERKTKEYKNMQRKKNISHPGKWKKAIEEVYIKSCSNFF